jgi:electron transport complex protein RnfE
MMGGIRELLGSGAFLGVNVFGPSFEPWVIMALPPGGFFTIGFILLGFASYRHHRSSKVMKRSLPVDWRKVT